jgi:hypothetical protein
LTVAPFITNGGSGDPISKSESSIRQTTSNWVSTSPVCFNGFSTFTSDVSPHITRMKAVQFHQ